MRLGITGCSGFIGSAAVPFLQEMGHEVFSLSAHARGMSQAPLPALDFILHLGGATGSANPGILYEANVLSTLRMLEIAREKGCPVIFTSTYVYGVPRYMPVDEKHPVSILNPYTGSKWLAEELCGQYRDLFGVRVVILRLFNIFGEDPHPGRLISSLLRNLRSGEPLVVNDPTPRRDHLYIRDLLDLLTEVLRQNPGNLLLNVGSGKSISNLEVAKLIAATAGLPEERIKIQHQPRQNEIPDCVANSSLATKSLGWVPRTSLAEGLTAIISDWKIAP